MNFENTTVNALSEDKDAVQDSQPILVLLVEDHPIVRDGITPIIQSLSDNVQLFYAHDLKTAMVILEHNAELSLVLVDLMLPDGSGLELLKFIEDADLNIPVAVFSGTDDVDTIEDALAKGAKGFITKDTNPELIIHALRLVLAGGMYIPAQLVGNCRLKVDAQLLGVSAEQRVRHLTSRQMEVFRLLVTGQTNREIAAELNCAEATIKAHVTAVLKTVGVANRSAAIEAVNTSPWLRNVLDSSSDSPD